VRVEKIVVLGLARKPSSVVLAGKELEWAFVPGVAAAGKKEGTASVLTIKDPRVGVASDWEIVIKATIDEDLQSALSARLPKPAGPPPSDDDDDDDPDMNAEEYATYTAVPHIQIVITPPLPSRQSLPESMRLALDAILASAPIAEQSDDSHSVAGDECPLSLDEDSTHAPPFPTISACPDWPAAPVLAPPHHSQTHHPPPAVIDTAEEPPTRNERLRRADSQMVLRRPMHVQKRSTLPDGTLVTLRRRSRS
ncbi:hypothetical protein EWM64_g3909, partial [Hericium alpestre]